MQAVGPFEGNRNVLGYGLPLFFRLSVANSECLKVLVEVYFVMMNRLIIDMQVFCASFYTFLTSTKKWSVRACSLP